MAISGIEVTMARQGMWPEEVDSWKKQNNMEILFASSLSSLLWDILLTNRGKNASIISYRSNAELCLVFDTLQRKMVHKFKVLFLTFKIRCWRKRKFNITLEYNQYTRLFLSEKVILGSLSPPAGVNFSIFKSSGSATMASFPLSCTPCNNRD